MEFAIPLCREELLKDDGKGTYAVKECLASVELVRHIDECQSLFAEIGPAAIIECFDVFFSVLQHFTNADASVKESYWNCVMEGLVDFCKILDEADWMNGAGSGGCPSNKLELRNTLKMLVYVVVQFAEAFENEAVKPAGLEIPTRRRKKRVAPASSSGRCVWEMERERVVQTLLHLLELQLTQLCDPPTPEMLDNFTNMVAGCCFKLLENPAVVQDKDVCEVIFNLLGLVVKTYNQGVGISLKAVQLLQHFEHIVGPLARAVAVIANKFEAHGFVADIIREVGQKDPGELSSDTSGTRYYAAFIVEVAQAVPGLVYPSISHLLPHLNGESHTMRNGVLAVIGAVVSHEMADPVNLSEQQRDTRDQLLDKLQDHLHDVNAFVRSKSLNVWQQLCNDKAIPLPRLKVVLELAVGRLRDKSSLVRKNAVQLLTTLLTRNPFDATLKLEEYRSKLEAAKNDLRQLMPDGESDGTRDTEQVGEVAHQLVVVKFLQDAVEFTEKMVACVPVAAQLLGSRVTSDILEALEFLAVCEQFGLQGAHDGLRKALALVWSSEASVKTAVTSVYVRLYLTPDETASSQQRVADVVRNLLSLVSGATVGELTSLEELLVLLVKAGKISKAALQMLVDIVAGCVPTFTDSCQAMLLLSMVARVDQEIVSSNIAVLVQNGLGKDLSLARNCCLALQRLATPNGTNSSRMPASHQLFQRLSRLMIDEVSNTATVLWCPFAEQAIATIFKLAEQPDHVCAAVLRDVCHRVLGNNDSLTGQSYSVLLSRLFFMAGQVTKEQMIHLEVAVLREMKRRRLQREEQHVRESSARSDRGRRSINKQAQEVISMEEEMGLDGAAADDMEGELMRRVCEEDVCGSGLLASLLPLIVMVLSNPSSYPSVQLQSSAVLALSKYMLVSSSVCECYLQLMFTLLEKSPTPCIRANAVVSLGDMAVRFPNLIEPWTHHLYARVRDNSSLVRHHAIVVLTHLVLNDMIKVHGSISEMALCLEDEESCIADRARLFFLELSKKGNTLYNVIPDVVSRLSDPSLSVSETGFRAIMKYILGFIQKDKQNENLVDKLCHRLRAARTEKQWRDMAFCLSQLNYSEKCLHKLQDNFACYQNKLTENGVYSSLSSILQKAKKFSKPEVKALVEELEVKMLAAHRKGLTERLGPTGEGETTEGDHTATAEEEETSIMMAPTALTPSCTKTPQSRTVASSERRRRQPLSDHNRSMDQEEGDDFKLSAVSSARRSGSRSRIVQTSENEEEEFVKPRTRRRKGRGVVEKRGVQSIRKALCISDSDEN